MLASHWNLPVFGWVSNNHELKDRQTYSTLIRVLGPLNKFCEYPISHLINPLTMRVVGAPQMILQPVSSILPCSSLPSGTW